jgi:hypothetical protein
MTGRRVQGKTMGIMGYGKDSRGSRVQSTKDDSKAMGKRVGVTDRSGWIMECVYACILAVLILVMILATSLASVLIQRLNCKKASAVAVEHHRKTRRESATSGEAKNERDGLQGNQRWIWNHVRAILNATQPFPQDQMIYWRRRHTHGGKVGKRG